MKTAACSGDQSGCLRVVGRADSPDIDEASCRNERGAAPSSRWKACERLLTASERQNRHERPLRASYAPRNGQEDRREAARRRPWGHPTCSGLGRSSSTNETACKPRQFDAVESRTAGASALIAHLPHQASSTCQFDRWLKAVLGVCFIAAQENWCYPARTLHFTNGSSESAPRCR